MKPNFPCWRPQFCFFQAQLVGSLFIPISPCKPRHHAFSHLGFCSPTQPQASRVSVLADHITGVRVGRSDSRVPLLHHPPLPPSRQSPCTCCCQATQAMPLTVADGALLGAGMTFVAGATVAYRRKQTTAFKLL